MSRAEAIEHYHEALRRGQRYYHDCVSRGVYPYPQVLESIYPESFSAARQDLGVLEIPTDAIVGTLADGRKAAFAGNFMPLLNENTEFAAKWVNLCEAHLGATGITDPISCYEYMGKFYVQEGHKRVSVLRSYDAPAIQARVTRVFPAWSDDPAIIAYNEFLGFYKRSRIYAVQFTHPGCFDRLEAALGFEAGHVWTDEERASFMSMFWVLREACTQEVLDHVRDRSLSEVLLSCLDLYPYEQLSTLGVSDMAKRVNALLPDLKFASEVDTVDNATVSTEPDIPGKSLVRSILDGISRPTLNVAFIFVNTPQTSVWTRGHDEGAKLMAEALGSQVRMKSYFVNGTSAEVLMERAVTEDGAQVLIATAPTLLAPARQCAALHPGVKVLVCALSVPYVGVRTYYSRIHEAKFISGAMAGALCGSEDIGYIARYPILGVPASINAFALGVRMTNPKARVHVAWSCLEGDPAKSLMDQGIHIISGHPVAASTPSNVAPGWSTSFMHHDGSMEPIASEIWNWGRTYEQIIRSILAGAWDNAAPRGNAVSYWWGMSSGVIDVEMADTVPEGVRQLATILKNGIIEGLISPFRGISCDQEGMIRADSDTEFSMEDLMQMNWLCDNVVGRIPNFDELLPMSRETTRLLALPQDTPAEAEKDAPDTAPEEGKA